MVLILFLILVIVIIEHKWCPRIDTTEEGLVLFYYNYKNTRKCKILNPK